MSGVNPFHQLADPICEHLIQYLWPREIALGVARASRRWYVISNKDSSPLAKVIENWNRSQAIADSNDREIIPIPDYLIPDFAYQSILVDMRGDQKRIYFYDRSTSKDSEVTLDCSFNPIRINYPILTCSGSEKGSNFICALSIENAELPFQLNLTQTLKDLSLDNQHIELSFGNPKSNTLGFLTNLGYYFTLDHSQKATLPVSVFPKKYTKSNVVSAKMSEKYLIVHAKIDNTNVEFISYFNLHTQTSDLLVGPFRKRDEGIHIDVHSSYLFVSTPSRLSCFKMDDTSIKESSYLDVARLSNALPAKHIGTFTYILSTKYGLLFEFQISSVTLENQQSEKRIGLWNPWDSDRLFLFDGTYSKDFSVNNILFSRPFEGDSEWFYFNVDDDTSVDLLHLPSGKKRTINIAEADNLGTMIQFETDGNGRPTYMITRVENGETKDLTATLSKTPLGYVPRVSKLYHELSMKPDLRPVVNAPKREVTTSPIEVPVLPTLLTILSAGTTHAQPRQEDIPPNTLKGRFVRWLRKSCFGALLRSVAALAQRVFCCRRIQG